MTSPLNLSDEDSSPDFTVCSFYKMFGYPDLGALIVRRSSSHILQHRRYFGGGTVAQLMSSTNHVKRHDKDPHEHLEDGTCAFHSIIALGHAIDTHKRLFGSFSRISLHTSSLASLLATLLSELTHPRTGRKAVEIYTEENHGDPKAQGPVIAINLQTATGEFIGFLTVEAAAAARNIHIRSGGHCNPGGVEQYCGLTAEQMKANFDSGKECGDDLDVVNGKPMGAVRVSLGAMSTVDDVLRFVDFVNEEYVNKPTPSVQMRKMLLRERKKEVAEAKKLMKKYGTVVSSSSHSGKTSCFWADPINPDDSLQINARRASVIPPTPVPASRLTVVV
jgi:molybdenum cofactor sulfurtransferase